MLSLIEVLNTRTKELLIQKAIKQLLGNLFTDAHLKVTMSSFMFKGYLITVDLRENEFAIVISEEGAMPKLYTEKGIVYSLEVCVTKVRQWLEQVMFDDENKFSPFSNPNTRQWYMYLKHKPGKNLLFPMYAPAIEKYKMGIAYY